MSALYGDGSAGALTVTGTAPNILQALAPMGNLQFTDVTIERGARLIVTSGTVLRCTGRFTLRGSLSVSPFASGSPDLDSPPHPGLARSSATNGQTGSATIPSRSGRGGFGIGENLARYLVHPGLAGGGGGGVSPQSNILTAIDGGGTMTILCRGAIENDLGGLGALPEGGITVPGAGGGGGGVLILGSGTSITNRGTISVAGGAGVAGNSAVGPGGGGGGGLVRLIAPTITLTGGTIDVAGGAPGAMATVTLSTRSGGGGGGGCVGDGGGGGGVSTSGVVSAATAGAAGFLFSTTIDPARVL
ncbi:MAG: hypothetical protein U0324_14110 [Polyangiales bacterium]